MVSEFENILNVKYWLANITCSGRAGFVPLKWQFSGFEFFRLWTVFSSLPPSAPAPVTHAVGRLGFNRRQGFKRMNKTSLHQFQPAWAGILGPMLFVAIFTIEGWLRSEYEPTRMYISELSLGSRGWIQNSNFIVFGLLFLMFTRSVATEFHNRTTSQGSIILLTIIAVCYLSFGFFIMDPINTPRDEWTFSGILHALIGEAVLVLMPVSCFVFLQRFRKEAKWEFLQWWTIVLGTIIAIASFLMIVSMNLPSAQKALNDWLGLIQRFSIVPYMIWLFIFALGLLRQSKM